MAIIGDDDRGRTEMAGKQRSKNSGGHPGKDYRGVSCIICGEVMDYIFPGQNGTATHGCPNGCNNSSGGGVTQKTIKDVRRELNQNRGWKERASLKER